VSDAGSIHPKNAAGPFYVLNGCCTACGVPTAIAPELFEFDSTHHCYVKRQPSSNAEMEKALHVLRGQELGCVRYRGTDEAILRRLAEAGEAQQCDHPPADVGVVLRNVVTFAISDSNYVPRDAPGFLEQVSAHQLVAKCHEDPFFHLLAADGQAIGARASRASPEASQTVAPVHDVPAAALGALRQTGEEILRPSCPVELLRIAVGGHAAHFDLPRLHPIP
jgi:hypothetical protein